MKKNHLLAIAMTVALGSLSFSANTFAEPSSPKLNEYVDWRVLSVSHRNDKNTLRAILGNDIAIKASRENKTKPWPEGSIIAKVVWKERTHPNWGAAIVPAEFSAAEAMIKDSKKYASTGGWGYGHWVNGKLEMHPEAKAKTCYGCHKPMKDNDYVYTFSAPMKATK
ncbi:MAG: cytochrome P460 family protein [Methylococcales bacterium]|nr:cytochrome P460 family protein [Methylococcales bacterium]